MNFTDRFSARAGAYVASRPSYPPAAIDTILEGLADRRSLIVADLGAGTGISSRSIASRGPRVLAVEPNAKMRDAAEPDARVSYIDGTAEATTLGAASVDAAVAFQAWHWVDHPTGIAEMRRIVRSPGRLAVVYNERDETDAFTLAFGEIVRRFAQDRTEARRADAIAAFAAVDPMRTRRFAFANGHELDREAVHQRARSSSYLPQTGDAATAMHGAIDELVDRFGGGPYDMRLVKLVVRVDVM